jgi:hypothetical protein
VNRQRNLSCFFDNAVLAAPLGDPEVAVGQRVLSASKSHWQSEYFRVLNGCL